jgi:hypothetical protein
MQSEELGDQITARNEYEHERKVVEGSQVRNEHTIFGLVCLNALKPLKVRKVRIVTHYQQT